MRQTAQRLKRPEWFVALNVEPDENFWKTLWENVFMSPRLGRVCRCDVSVVRKEKQMHLDASENEIFHCSKDTKTTKGQ